MWLRLPALINSLGDEDGILVLGPPIHVIDVVSSVVRIVDSLPTEGQLILVALFGSALLNARQSGVEPMRRPRVVVYKVGLALIRVGLFPVGGQGAELVGVLDDLIIGIVRVRVLSDGRRLRVFHDAFRRAVQLRLFGRGAYKK